MSGGAEIDAYDTVIRFNKFAIDGFESHTGVKTTHVFANRESILSRWFADKMFLRIIRHSYEPIEFNGDRTEVLGLNLYFGTNLETLMQAVVKDGHDKMPTAGLACLLALEAGGAYDVRVFGYEDSSTQYTHYAGAERSIERSEKEGHDIPSERRLFRKICERNGWRIW